MRQISVLWRGSLIKVNRWAASVPATAISRRRTGFGMTERSRRESLLLGAIAGAILAIGIIVPLIALNI